MLFSKNVIAAAALLLSVSLQAHAHAAISPMLGVKGTPARSDVQRPTTAKPCGSVNIAKTFDTSSTIALKANDSFAATIQNFNAGVDGSLQITTVKVDPTGTGKKFVAATMIKNGEKAPTTVKSEQLTVQLPAGTQCTGGATKNKCLVSFTTAGGFGNCVVVQSAKKAAREDAVGTRAARALRLAEEELA
ncbi:hypothetical protein C8Q80DRAFT_1266015 [Daedaleopsis nitida]|nr:hypothetical protein C8Q80DRAFT_1266015 [Daedaleopsis nitida]